jgi:putative oxidoreductase
VPAQANNLALLLCRLLIASLYLPTGLGKVANLAPFVAMLRDNGLPYPEVFAVVGVTAEVLAPIALILGLAPRITAIVMIGFTLVATAISHRYWTFTDPVLRQAQYLNFYKNMAIIGGLCAYWAAGAGDWTLRGLTRRDASPARKQPSRR